MGEAPLPKVAIILVSYKGKEDTLECLRSLDALTYPFCAVIVVDQDSQDGTPDAVRDAFPGAHVIENPVNNGFAGGNNVGMRAALESGADYLFLLNNDTVVEPGLLEPLVTLAETDKRIGIVGPKMLYHGEPDTIWAAGGAVDWRGRSVLLDEGSKDTPDATPREVDFIVGCGLMIKRGVIEKVGLLDERYFLYYEETDLCARVREAGYRIVYQPAARLWHKVSRSTGVDSPLTLYYMRRNGLLYLSRHGTPGARLWALCDALRLALIWTAQGKHRRRRVLLRAVADYLRGQFGKSDMTFQWTV